MGRLRGIEDIQPFAELAQNATTLVYKAYQASLERFVLLKRLRPEFSGDEELSARFQEEARLIARVPHPNIVSIYSYGSDADGAYIVAEFVDGQDLETQIGRGRIPPPIAVFILLECVRGLKAAHDKDILHRDLKPSNILISTEGEVKLSDFGLASISSEASEKAEIRGTLPYLAPEQVLGESADRRSDLFSLGAVFYEVLTGRRAFGGGTSSEIFEALLNHNPRPFLSATPGVDADVERICARLLAKDPSDRYSGCDELIADLDRARDPSVGQDALKAYLDDPEDFAVAAAPRVADTPAPDVAIVRDETRPARREVAEGSLRRIALVAAAAVVVIAGLFWGGRLLLDGGDRGGGPDRSTLRETMLTDTLDGDPRRAAQDTLVADALASSTGSEMPAGGAPAEGETQARPAPVDGEARSGDRETQPGDSETPEDDAADEDAARRGEADAEPGEQAARDAPPNVDDPTGERPADAEAAGEDETPLRDEPAATGQLEVRVEPAATVLVDGDSIGTASGSRAVVVSLEAGMHTLTLKNRYFPTYTQRVEVDAGRTEPVRVSLFDLVGRLELHIYPFAYVYVDDDSLGVTPFSSPLILTPGVHRLRMVNEELNVDHAVPVTIEKGRTIRREFDLTRLGGR